MAAVVFATASGAPISPSSPSSEATARALLLNDDAPVTSLSEQLAALPTVTTCVARERAGHGRCGRVDPAERGAPLLPDELLCRLDLRHGLVQSEQQGQGALALQRKRVTATSLMYSELSVVCGASLATQAIASLSQAQPACGGVSGYRRRRRLEMEAGTRWIRHLLDLCTIALRDLSRKKEHILLARVAQLDE